MNSCLLACITLQRQVFFQNKSSFKCLYCVSVRPGAGPQPTLMPLSSLCGGSEGLGPGGAGGNESLRLFFCSAGRQEEARLHQEQAAAKKGQETP